MNEQQVTVEGTTHPLPAPFFVIATQNPVDFQGTYPLPEAQLDRFLVRLTMGYPAEDDELRIMTDRQQSDPLVDLEPVATAEQILELQRAVRQVQIKEPVARYILKLAAATRVSRELELGVSTRGVLAVYRAAQARALMANRSYVTPDDIQALAVPTLAHRVMQTPQTRYGGTGNDSVVATLLETIPVPT
jgi:MoxR-like ATPase